MNTQIMNPKNRKLISTEDKNQKDENKIRDDKKENATERRPNVESLSCGLSLGSLMSNTIS